MTFAENLEKYAELAVRIGCNIQPGQSLWINGPIDSADLIRLITRKAYEAGAKNVQVEWYDQAVNRLKYDLAPEEAFGEYPAWRARALEQEAEKNGAYLYIESNDPELMKGVDPKRLSAFSKAAGAELVKWREYMGSYRMTWCIIGAPSVGWARKVYPDKEDSEAVQALWEAIFRATRADQDDPVALWREHNAKLRAKREQLTAKQYRKLHYRAPGTELTVALPERHLWRGGSVANTRAGFEFNPNVPTEEVFVSPHRDGTNGVVHSTKPLSYQGSLIENFSLTFENGRVVDFQAEKGYENLKNLVELDEGSHYLGEIALVPHDSPISNSKQLFFNTLYDENASNHLALGRAFPTTLEGGEDLSPEEQLAAGLNTSLTHVDFMIGSAEMDIDGELADGTIEPIFRKGNWAF
ncbi:aminopeptidase [Paenibacillus aurantius]|uniref:Aminopeptidase n=1 Tax=Paenibacillus aurantius TaxID=2918900 RepID=A0AA96LC18_9BACL|nr:aminopeptidase [Paenibacillus aurantius]WNQ10881.1 aminopeptidase [Paenibacillus aurantius]